MLELTIAATFLLGALTVLGWLGEVVAPRIKAWTPGLLRWLGVR